MQRLLAEYCSNASIHGVRYFTEQKRHWTERCWWIISICLSIWFCGSLIENVWIEWCDNPVKMTMTEKPLPISSIPFPTVTICPETKTYKSKLDLTHLNEMPKKMWNLSEVQ